MAEPTLSATGSVRHARAVRRCLGARNVDALFGVQGRREAARALLTNQPEGGTAAVNDGWDLLAHIEQRHPRGLRSRRLAHHLLSLAGLIVVVAMALFLLALVALGVLWVLTLVDWHPLGFDPAEDYIGPWMILPAAIGVILSVLVACLSGFASMAATIAKGRMQVRWAAQRPGQARRGIPAASPFRGLTTGFSVTAVIVGFLAAILLITWFFFMFGQDWRFDGAQGGFNLGLTIVVWGLAVVAYGVSWLAVTLSGAERVATTHLFLLQEREDGVPVDMATAAKDTVLVVPQRGPVVEWAVYPHTAGLSKRELKRRSSLITDVEWMGPPDRGPIVTRSTSTTSTSRNQLLDAYQDGSIVAEATWLGEPATLWVVADQPNSEALLQFLADYPAFDADSVREHAPVPVGADPRGKHREVRGP